MYVCMFFVCMHFCLHVYASIKISASYIGRVVPLPFLVERDIAGLGQALFDTGSVDALRPDVVSLPAFEEDRWWYKNFTSAWQVVRMQELFADDFSYLEEKLSVAPPLLAMIILPLAYDESDATLWPNGTECETFLRSDCENSIFVSPEMFRILTKIRAYTVVQYWTVVLDQVTWTIEESSSVQCIN